MELELATTVDMIEELRKRGFHFVFVGVEGSNRREREVVIACQGRSWREMRQMLRAAERHLGLTSDRDANKYCDSYLRSRQSAFLNARDE